MLDKRLARIIARLLGDLHHLGADPLHFAQADIVNFVGAPVGRRHLPDAEIIIFRAAGLGRDAGGLGAFRCIVLHIPVEMLAHRRVDHGFDRLGRLVGQRRIGGFVDRLRLLAGERLVEARVFRVIRQQPGNAGFIAFHRDAGLDIAAGQRLVGDGDRLVIDLGILFQPVDIGPVILRVAEWQVVLHAGEILVPAAAVGEVNRALAIAVRLDLLSERPAEDAIVGLVILAQRPGVDRIQPFQPGPGLFHALVFRLQAGIADPPDRIFHPERGSEFRILLELIGPVIVNDSVQGLGLRGSAMLGRRGLGVHRRGGEQRERQQQGKSWFWHFLSPEISLATIEDIWCL